MAARRSQTQFLRVTGLTNLSLYSSFPWARRIVAFYAAKVSPAGETLSFWLAGHNGVPDQPDAGLNRVRLIESASGKVLHDTLPPRNDMAQRIAWDTSLWRGSQVQVELIDGDQSDAYAWLAVGGFSDLRLNPAAMDTTWNRFCHFCKSTNHRPA